MPQSFNEKIIQQIASLGHEIGYHYEDLSRCKGNMEKAIQSFEQNLQHFRKIYPVETICMHGSPFSKYNNRDLWKYCNYKDYGIIGEPYTDIDFTQVLYLTDTGRRWDGERVNVRDIAFVWAPEEKYVNDNPSVLRTSPLKTGEKLLNTKYNFRTTFDIIRTAKNGNLPDKIMITVHPQRWNNRAIPWIKEYVFQNCKNVIKRYLFVKRETKKLQDS